MRTPVEINFDTLIRESFHALLKPLGYQKKLYLSVEIGKLINIQKSLSSTKDQIKFTINLGLFSTAYWQLIYNYFAKLSYLYLAVAWPVRRSEFSPGPVGLNPAARISMVYASTGV